MRLLIALCTAVMEYCTGPYCIVLIGLFFVHFCTIFCLILCSKLSWLPISFWLHIKSIVSSRIPYRYLTFNYKLKYMVIYISVQNAIITVTFYFDTTMYYMLAWIGNIAQTLAFLVFIGFSSLLLSTSVMISTWWSQWWPTLWPSSAYGHTGRQQ